VLTSVEAGEERTEGVVDPGVDEVQGLVVRHGRPVKPHHVLQLQNGRPEGRAGTQIYFMKHVY